MNNRGNSPQHVIAVSTSESPDMDVLGLSDEHLRDAMAEIARHVLSFGSSLVYGGDLRQDGFSELLFELVARHHPVDDNVETHMSVTNFLAWPVHILMSIQKIEEASETLTGSAELVCLDINGKPMSMQYRRQLDSRQPTEGEWSKGLTAMRRHMLTKTHARIVLGGRTEQYKGSMPGIGEEALLSLQSRQPLFVIGGFGGCARDIAESLELVEKEKSNRRVWDGLKAFDRFSAADLKNGLTLEDNSTLATTPHIDQAIVLILRGLLKVADTRSVDRRAKLTHFTG